MTRQEVRDAWLLAPLGLTELDESVYRSLLDRPEVSLAELSARTGASTGSLSRTIDRLERYGLLSHIPGRPRRYKPANPEAGIEALLRPQEERLARVRSGIDEMVLAFREGSREQRDAGGLVEVLRGKNVVAQRFAHLQLQVSGEMLLFDRPPYASPSPTNPLEEQALARGVAWRTIYTPDSLGISGQPNEMRRLISLGEQARVNQHVPLKLAIADREIGLVPLTSAHPETRLVVVHASSLLDALVDLFELYWAQALPLDETRNPSKDLNEDDERLLSLLLAGFKDDAIARQMKISPRTLGRRMLKLSKRLGAHTRFQAGYQTARRGWP